MHKHAYREDPLWPGTAICECTSRVDVYTNHHSYKVLWNSGGNVKIDADIHDAVRDMLNRNIPVFASCQGGCLQPTPTDWTNKAVAEAYAAAFKSNVYSEGYFAIHGNHVKTACDVANKYVKITDVEFPAFGMIEESTRIAFEAPFPCSQCLNEAERWMAEL